MNQNCGQKKIVFGGPKENGARKASAFKGNQKVPTICAVLWY